MRLPALGPFREGFFSSPLRGPWLTSVLGAALLPLLAVCALTGFISHAAYDPDLGGNAIFGGPGPGNGFDLYGFDWLTRPVWLYAATQGLHVVTGIAAIPILLAKLWAVIPKLFENPPLRTPAHALERLSLVLLVGGGLFVIATGVINIQLWYPFGFSFVPAHYYGAIIFLAALVLHVALKLPLTVRAFRERGLLAPLRDDLEHTRPEEPRPASPPDPHPAGSPRRSRGGLGRPGGDGRRAGGGRAVRGSGAAGAARTRARPGAQRLPGEPHVRRRGHPEREGGPRLAPAPPRARRAAGHDQPGRAAGHGAGDRRASDRLRGGLVEHPALDGRAPCRPGPPRRRGRPLGCRGALATAWAARCARSR